MHARLSAFLIAFWLAAPAAAQEGAQPQARTTLNAIADVGPAIRACWKPPVDAGGSEMTLVFALTRTGEVLGKPRISYSKLLGDQAAQQRFVASVLGALAACTPLSLSEGLGGAIAGRPFSLQFRSGRRPTRV